jgi:hypothetical protein
MNNNIQALSHFIILDSDILLSSENTVSFDTLNEVLEVLCQLICNRILYNPKTRMTILIKNTKLLDLMNRIEPNQEVFQSFQMPFNDEIVSLDFLKNLKILYKYFDSLMKCIEKNQVSWVLNEQNFAEEVLKPINSNNKKILFQLNKESNEDFDLNFEGKYFHFENNV